MTNIFSASLSVTSTMLWPRKETGSVLFVIKRRAHVYSCHQFMLLWQRALSNYGFVSKDILIEIRFILLRL